MELRYNIEILSIAGTFTLPNMDEQFLDRLNFAKSRNEVFHELDAHGNSMVIGTEHIVVIRAIKI